MLLPHDTIVAVADGVGLKLFRNAGNEAEPRLEPGPVPHLGDAGHPSGGRHHSSAANPDARLLREDGHAASIVRWLNQEVLSGRIRHLAVVAPPRSLGEMRLHYHAELRRCLVGEIGRTLGDMSPAAVGAALTTTR